MTEDPGGRPPEQEPPPPPGWGHPMQPPPPGYPGPGTPQKNNGLALASLVTGIAGIAGLVVFFLWPIAWIGSVLAVIFGHVSRRQIRERGEAGDGFSLAGIILGWVGTALWITAIGIIVLVFILGTTVKSAFESTCDPYGSSGTFTTTC